MVEKETRESIKKLYNFMSSCCKIYNIEKISPKKMLEDSSGLNPILEKLEASIKDNKRVLENMFEREEALEESLQVHKNEIIKLRRNE